MKCEACGAPTSGTRKFCDDLECKRERARDRKRKQRGQVIEFPTDDRGSVYRTTHAELVRADRLDTPLGQAALVLAQRLDAGAKDTGSSAAAVAREFKATLEEALRDVESEADAVDDLRGRVVRLVR